MHSSIAFPPESGSSPRLPRGRSSAPCRRLERSCFPSTSASCLTVTTHAGTFTDRVRGEQLRFEGPTTVSFAKPSTRDVLFCDGSLAAPDDGTTGPVAAVLGAGFNRSTLVSSAAQPVTDASSFYPAGLTNHYAKAMHAATGDGKAYGFAFDGVADFASYLQDTAPTGLRLALTPFQGPAPTVTPVIPGPAGHARPCFRMQGGPPR